MFVELSPSVLVDPTEIVMLSGTSNLTRVFLRGAGIKEWLTVERPFADVAAQIEAANPNPRTRTKKRIADLDLSGIPLPP